MSYPTSCFSCKKQPQKKFTLAAKNRRKNSGMIFLCTYNQACIQSRRCKNVQKTITFYIINEKIKKPCPFKRHLKVVPQKVSSIRQNCTEYKRKKLEPKKLGRRKKILCKIYINIFFQHFISLNVEMIPEKTSVSLHETLDYHLTALFSQLNIGLRRYLKI